jgi:predicted ribosome quality control (RQC) complex YloA/Tae2 family protein
MPPKKERLDTCEDSTGKIYDIVIGVNDQNNWDIITNASPNDLWFHVDDQPSCHVIIKTHDNAKIEKRVIKYAARLCKDNSKAKNQKNTKIIYTHIKNVIKGDAVGSVITSKTSVIVVK